MDGVNGDGKAGIGEGVLINEDWSYVSVATKNRYKGGCTSINQT